MPETYQESLARVRGKSRTGRERKQPTLPELQATEATLRALQQQTGAPEINRDEPGFFARTIDVLSGFNYAVAGAYEESQKGGDISAMLKRAGNELFSSFQSLPLGGFGTKAIFGEAEGAKKKAFGEVLEGLGFGTTTLGDVFPALNSSFLGKLINTRGTAGIALDILADPLTYISFGATAARKVFFRDLGERVLSKSGKGIVDDTVRQMRKKGGWEHKVLTAQDEWGRRIENWKGLQPDSVSELVASDELMEQGLRQLAFEKAVALHGERAILDRGGIKMFGYSVIEGKTIKEMTGTFGKPIMDLALRVPGMRPALDAGAYIGKKIRFVFDDTPGLEGLGPNSKRAVIDAQRKYVSGTVKLTESMNREVLHSDWFKWIKANPNSEKKIIQMVQRGEQAMLANLTAEELAAAKGLAAHTQMLGTDLAALGILDEAQVMTKGGLYYPSRYKNMGDDFDRVAVAHNNKTGSLDADGFDKARVFDSMEEGEKVSGHLADQYEVAKASGQDVIPHARLEGIYDVEDTLIRYHQWYANKKGMAFFQRELAAEFGSDLASKVDMDRVFKAATPIKTTDHEAGLINTAIKSFEKTSKVLTPAEAGTLKNLSAEGQQEYLRQAFLTAKSPEEAANLFLRYGDKYGDKIPTYGHVYQEGEFQKAFARFGEGADEYVVRGGNKLWGDGPKIVPKIISDHIDNIDRKIIGNDYKHLTEMTRGLDKVNNWFKLWVYPLHPSSAFRDAVSNVLFNSYRIGLHSIDPALHGHTARIMSGAEGFLPMGKTGRVLSYEHVRELINSTNIEQRMEDLVEMVGEGNRRSPISGMTETTKEGVRRFRGKGGPVKRLLKARNAMDNESRNALAIQNLIDGLSIDDASQAVGEYLFHYNELSPVMREIVRRFIPFATFAHKNIKQKASLLLKNPGMFANRYKPFRGRDSENSAMVKWEGEAMKIRLNRDGKTVETITGFDMPLRNLDFMWRGNLKDTLRSGIGMMNPIIKAGVEMASGVDMFTGRDLTRRDHAFVGMGIEKMNPPQAVKNWLGYKKEVDAAGRPKYSFDGERVYLLTNSWIFSRIMSTTDRQFREYIKDGGMEWSKVALDVGTGVRRRSIDMNEQELRKLGMRIRELQDVLARRGVLKKFEVTGKTPQELEQ